MPYFVTEEPSYDVDSLEAHIDFRLSRCTSLDPASDSSLPDRSYIYGGHHGLKLQISRFLERDAPPGSRVIWRFVSDSLDPGIWIILVQTTSLYKLE